MELAARFNYKNQTFYNFVFVFQDEVLADGKVVIDLIDAIKPGSINYDLVLPGGNEEVRQCLIIIILKLCFCIVYE